MIWKKLVKRTLNEKISGTHLGLIADKRARANKLMKVKMMQKPNLNKMWETFKDTIPVELYPIIKEKLKD